MTPETSATADAEPTIFAALAAVMGDVQAVRKGDRNQTQGYSFRGVDAVVNAVGPALRKHGVIVVPLVEHVEYNTVEVGQRRTQLRECIVRVRYVFHGPAGDRIECVSAGEAMDSGDKATPKALSVAYRVALLQALCIPTDEPEVDASTYERAPARVERTRQRSTQDAVPRETGSQHDDPPPRLMSQPQQRKLMALLKAAGHVEREQRLAYCSAAVGRELASSSDLTLREAATIIDGLEQALTEPHDETPRGPA